MSSFAGGFRECCAGTWSKRPPHCVTYVAHVTCDRRGADDEASGDGGIARRDCFEADTKEFVKNSAIFGSERRVRQLCSQPFQVCGQKRGDATHDDLRDMLHCARFGGTTVSNIDRPVKRSRNMKDDEFVAVTEHDVESLAEKLDALAASMSAGERAALARVILNAASASKAQAKGDKHEPAGSGSHVTFSGPLATSLALGSNFSPTGQGSPVIPINPGELRSKERVFFRGITR